MSFNYPELRTKTFNIVAAGVIFKKTLFKPRMTTWQGRDSAKVTKESLGTTAQNKT